MSNRGNFTGLTQHGPWRAFGSPTDILRAFTASGAVTQPILTNPTITARYIVNASGKVHYNGLLTFGSSDTFGSGDHLWGIRLPVPANRSSGGADLPIGTGWAWQNSVSNLNLVMTPTLMDPEANDGGRSNEDYYAQFFISEQVASGTGTFASGATALTITHGLYSTPTAKDIQITATNSASTNPRILYIDTITSTQFNVNVGASSTTTPQQFSWKARCWPNASNTLDLLMGSLKPWTWASGMSIGWSLVYEARR